MKYKNIIFLLCDSFTYVDDSHIYNNFNILNKYKRNIKFFDNIYSQGPYTEAAINSLLTSTRTLDYDGYFQNLNRPVDNIFEIAKKNGYYVTSSILNYCNNDGFFEGVDSYIYFQFIEFDYIIDYRLNYLKTLYNEKKINKYHINQMKKMFSSFFYNVDKFINDYYFNEESFIVLKEKYNINSEFIEKYREEIDVYKNLFEKNNEDFLYGLLSGKYKIKTLEKPSLKTNDGYKKYKKNIDKKCINKSIFQFIKTLCKYRRNNSTNCFRNNLDLNNFLRSVKNNIMYTLNYTMYPIYNNVSFEYIKDLTIKTLCNNKDRNNFIFMHAMDTHFPFNFFSYDVNNSLLIKNEYLDFIKILKDRNYYNKFYDLSLNYVNNKIEQLIDVLNEKSIMKDTLLIITSDHGCSYLSNVFRKNKVSNLYDETYKTPLIIYNPDINGSKIDNYGSSIDTIPTICDIAKLVYDKDKCKGVSMLNNSRKFVGFEFLGSGCPDISLKNKELAVRGKKFKIHASVPHNSKFSIQHITEIYNINADPKELNNIKDIIINEGNFEKEIKILINELNNRVEGMEKNNEFCN